MKIIKLIPVCVFISLLSTGCFPVKKTVNFKEQWDTTRVLKNPHKGWYHHLLDNGIAKYKISNDSLFSSFPGMDHLYLRLAWSYLEPIEGQFDWHRIDEVVDKYVPLGYKISFRISCKETGTFPGTVGQEWNGVQYATPAWVEKAGAKGTVSVIKRRQQSTNNDLKSWVPKWDDPVYLEKLDQFHRAFAARYDGQPWLSYVDIGSIGDWGEGHTSSSTNIPPTVTEVKANVDVFLKNYKKSQLVVPDDLLWYRKSDEDTKTLYDYVTKNGISLRDDSPLVNWYVETYLESGSISHPQFYDPLYLQKPIILETGHYTTVKKDGNWQGKNGGEKISKYGQSGAEILRKAIGVMHATYIGYHGYAEEWLAENPDLAREFANLCGYWYFPVSASYPSILKSGGNELIIEWLNKGVAPAYNEFEMLFRLESEIEGNSFDLQQVNSGNKYWLPGINKTEKYMINIPSDAKKGSYTLKIRLTDQSGKSNVPVQIGLKESLIDSKGFLKIGKVLIK